MFLSNCIINKQLHMGLSVPYLRILKITKQTADAMLHQFKYLKLFLYFLRFFNSRLSTATMDYHRTGFSLIQMQYKESEDTVCHCIHMMNNVFDSLKIDSLPEEYSKISTFLSDLAVYYAPKCNDPVEIEWQEIEWLGKTVALNHG